MNNDPIDENARIRRLIELDKSALPIDGGPGFNRLIFSTSPYLLQHAANPVDWYPWGEEAFAKATAENKPVFLSIGYATCHWCHVMAHESFEDEEVAAAFNYSFVCIKVDREERPDIDEQYMAVAQMMTGSGGWPLNIFMTPEKKPFFAVTYMPRTSRMGLPGIIQFIDRVAELWHTERQKLEKDSDTSIEALARLFRARPGPLPEMEVAENAFKQLAGMYDSSWGGFGSAPKFPMPVYLSFLLRFWKRSGDTSALEMVVHTLRMLRRGGIFDQIGFGFHRYSVDQEWLVPHFEKMLYDQALISLACLEAFQATGDRFYLQTAEEVFRYVSDEMTSSEGGFFAGQDADTEGEEGLYYLWTPSEIRAAIGEKGQELLCRLFDVTEMGNFEGRNILHLTEPLERFATKEGILPEFLSAELEQWRQTLLSVRRGRVRPFRDEKVVAGWNGLMIATLARGYALTGEAGYLTAAERAALFIDTKLTDSFGRLMRSYHLERASVPGFLEDYAFYINGLIELHQATLKPAFLKRSLELSNDMLRLFGGPADKGLFETGYDSEQLPVRQQSAHDGVLPSGNSMAAFDLLRLGRVTGDEDYSRAGETIARAFMGDVARQPVGFLNLLSAVDYHTGPPVTITISGREEELDELLRVIHRRYIPNLAVRYGGEGEDGEFPAVEGGATAYICAGGACRPPVTGGEALDAQLDDLGFGSS